LPSLPLVRLTGSGSSTSSNEASIKLYRTESLSAPLTDTQLPIMLSTPLQFFGNDRITFVNTSQGARSKAIV
jgi:hypothetical protein